MIKVFSNQFLQEKLDLVDVKLKLIENKGILIESEVWIRFIWASCQSFFIKLPKNFSSSTLISHSLKGITEISNKELMQEKLEKCW